MHWTKRILFRSQRRDRKQNRNQDLERELSFHLDKATEAHALAGVPLKEARRRAAIELGGREQVRQQTREVHVSWLLEAIATNGRAAARFIRKSPAFALVIIATLALGIGANTAVFSAVEAVLLQPLGFPAGDRLAVLAQHDQKNSSTDGLVAPPRLEDWNRLNRTFTAISGYYTQSVSELSGSLPERLDEVLLAPRFFEVWGVPPALGRPFTTEEEHFGGPSAVVISDRYWHNHFQASTGAIGKQLRLGTSAYTVVGVMPANFPFPERDADLWTPSPVDAPYAQSREATWYVVVGRLRPGVSLEEARTDLNQVQGQLGRQFAKTDRDLVVAVTPLKQLVLGTIGKPMWLLYGAVTLLLLIACSNIMALLLARTSQREHEISIRFSLGASRRAIVTQLLSEVLVLALTGAALGLLVAAAAVQGLHHLAKTIPRAEEITLSWPILLYTVVCALAVTLACGLLPAVRGTRRELARSLALGSRTQVSGHGSLQWLLVGTQVAFAVTLLVSAGLLLRSFEALGRTPAGFEASHVLALQVSGAWGETMDMKALTGRIDRTLEAVRATPGVEAAATSAALPGVAGSTELAFAMSDGPVDPHGAIKAVSRYISSDYFRVLQIPLLQGEPCRAQDAFAAVVVNRSFATTYLHGQSAVGRHVRLAAAGQFLQTGLIRGIVADAREDGLNTPPMPTVYWCTSAASPMPQVLVRTRGEPLALAETIRRTIHQVSPTRAVYGVSALTEHIDEQSYSTSLLTLLLALFAAAAVTLASIGLYGTLSYLGRLRQKELGLRLALGATRLQIAQRLLSRAMYTAGFGCVAGLLLGWAAARLLGGMLYGVRATDPATYAGTACLVVGVAALAALAPALRAMQIEPVQVLRQE